MAVGIWRVDFSPRVETNFYLRREQKMGKSLITNSMQWTNFGLMVVSQWTAMLRIVVKQQTNTCPQVIYAQQTDSGLMVVLQRMAMPRVVTRPQENISPVAKSALPCRHNTSRLGGNANYILERREVKMIFKGPREVQDS